MATKTTPAVSRSADEAREVFRESQELTTAMWQRWAESVQSMTPKSIPSFGSTWAVPSTDRLPDAKQAVDAAFDLAGEVLATQRRFIHEWINAVQPIVETARHQVETARHQVETAREQSEELAKTARRQTGEVAEVAEKTTRRLQANAKAATTPDYKSMTVEQLQEHASKADIDGRSGMNKDELVKALEKN